MRLSLIVSENHEDLEIAERENLRAYYSDKDCFHGQIIKKVRKKRSWRSFYKKLFGEEENQEKDFLKREFSKSG